MDKGLERKPLMSIKIKTNNSDEQTVEVQVKRPSWQQFIYY